MGASAVGMSGARPLRPHETGGPARIVGRYVLHSELAAGGMATVHLGRLRGEAGFTRTVAIKRLHPQFAKDPEFVAMFVDEARLAARIRHPNVVPTLDVIRDTVPESADGAPAREPETFLVMEYVAGESLSRLLRTLRQKKQLVPPRIATSILTGVLHGLHAAHEAKSEKGTPLGIVHRDVSPQNVLVGTDGIAHVLDFGVAKATGKLHTTREGELKGKLAYMAPEQLESGTLTRQSDVYAAAVVLWETLTLRRLFEGDSEGALLMQVVGSKIAPPSTVVAGIPRELDEIVMRGLARDPAKRWPTARDFALALEKHSPLASPTEIGEWVQSIAGDVLAQRAQLVAEVEGGSMSLRAAAPQAETPSVADALSQVSALALTSSEPAVPIPKRTRSARGPFFIGAIAGLVVVIALFAINRGPSHPPQSGAASAPPSQPAAEAPPLAAAPAPQPPATGATPQEQPAPAAVVTPPPSSPEPVPSPTAVATAVITTPPAQGWAPPARAASPSPPQPKIAAPKARLDCDPPFTRDALGHKHYKLQCL